QAAQTAPSPTPSPTPQMNFDLTNGENEAKRRAAMETLPKGRGSLPRIGPRLTETEKNAGLLTLPRTLQQATAPMVQNRAKQEAQINAGRQLLTPKEVKARQQAEAEKKAFEQKSALGQAKEIIGTGI